MDEQLLPRVHSRDPTHTHTQNARACKPCPFHLEVSLESRHLSSVEFFVFVFVGGKLNKNIPISGSGRGSVHWVIFLI